MSSSFENDQIKLNVEKKPGCKVVFSITTLAPATKAAEAEAKKIVSKSVNIPGFRKGRAPDALISTQFKGQIKREMLDVIGRSSLNTAMNLSRIFPANQNSPINLVKCEPIDDTSYAVVVEFESFPEVPRIDPQTLTVAHVEPEVIEEKQIETRIQELRQHHCTWKEIEGRAALQGDFVTLKIDTTEGGTQTNLWNNRRFHLEENKTPEWLLKLAIGLSVGETASGMAKTEAGEDKPVIIEMQKIEEAILPPLNDDLAKKAGVDSVEKLKEAIATSLKNEAATKARHTMRLSARKALIENYLFDLPGEHLKNLLKECTETINKEHPSLSKEEKDPMIQELFLQKKDNLSFSYLVYDLFADRSLQKPTAEEIRKRATEEMVMLYLRGQHNINENDMTYFTQIAENELVAERALDFLIENSKRA